MGHDLKMSIPMYPNGTYTGNAHGPTAAQYLVWTGASSIPYNQMAPGDLICWLTHIGIVVGNNQMISAYDTAKGTLVTSIAGAGPTGEGPGIVRRVSGAIGQVSGGAVGGNQGCVFPGTKAAMVVMICAISYRAKRRRYL